MGIRASGARKIPCKYHGMGAKTGVDITVEGDEGYTHVGENLPPSQQNEPFIEGKSCYWIEARAGVQTSQLLPKQQKHHGDGQNESIYSIVYLWREEICPKVDMPNNWGNGKCVPQIHPSKRWGMAKDGDMAWK